MLTVANLETAGIGPVSLTLAAGECVAVRGASGAGKSLLFRAIADLDPNRGEVALDGQSREVVSGPDWRKKVGYLATNAGWWGDTVAEHFRDWAACADMADALALPKGAGGWPSDQPSTGERQRLALIRLLERRPKVILLDEPTSGLDKKATDAAEGLIRAFQSTGGSVLLITHDDDQAARMATRAVLIEGGRLTEVEP